MRGKITATLAVRVVSAASSLLSAAVVALLATALHAEDARNNGADIYEACSVLASSVGDPPTSLKGNDYFHAMFCAGFVSATYTVLLRVHEHYKNTLQNYGRWNDEKFVKGWAASQLTLGFDVCFPEEKMRPKILAMIISKYGKEHPEDMAHVNSFDFAGAAFQSSYPPSRSETCVLKK
jgi:hypothetical protein